MHLCCRLSAAHQLQRLADCCYKTSATVIPCCCRIHSCNTLALMPAHCTLLTISVSSESISVSAIPPCEFRPRQLMGRRSSCTHSAPGQRCLLPISALATRGAWRTPPQPTALRKAYCTETLGWGQSWER